MLVISRKLEESIVINDNIVVTVISIQGGRIKLGIEAPYHLAVHRKEVWLETEAGRAAGAGYEQKDLPS